MPRGCARDDVGPARFRSVFVSALLRFEFAIMLFPMRAYARDARDALDVLTRNTNHSRPACQPSETKIERHIIMAALSWSFRRT